MNATMRKFGAPGTIVRDHHHWAVLLRPKQATLGALVLVCKDEARAFPEVSRAAFTELQAVSREIESAIKRAFDYDIMNYLMLMMVDPDVHFHVLPRYAGEREFAGASFTDPGWPGPPKLDWTNETTDDVRDALLRHIQGCFAALGD